MTTLGDRYEVDPVTVEVIGSAALSVAEEMGEALVHAAYSANIKERRDSSACIFDVQGRTLAQAAHIPMHLSSLLGVIEAVLDHYPRSQMADGDMFVGNDPYTAGGTHLPDITVVAPVFYQGEVIGFVANLGHHADFVDRGEGRHIFQEGLRIPPVKIMDRGEVRQDIMDFILTNCQLPKERLGDMRAHFAANRLGIRRLRELCDQYGRDLLFAAIEELLNYTERRTRAAIAQIPSGLYEFSDDFDSEVLPEPLPMHVRIEVAGEEIHLDFAKNPPQVPAYLNVQWTGLLASVYYAVKTLVDPTLPPNAGMYRAIHVSAPEGTIFNCVSPAATFWRSQTCQRIVDLIHGALAPALPDRVTAAHNGANAAAGFFGTNPRTGEYFYYLETMGGGYGARATKDGLDGVQVHMTNTTNLPVEALEQDYPLLVERYDLITDSGGPGTWRGGMGFERRIKVLEGDCLSSINMSRRESAPWGLFGGQEGGTGQIILYPRDGQPEDVTRRTRLLPLHEGDSLGVLTPGAGGYGDPRKRDRALVIKDLREGRITRDVALSAYGLTPQEADQALEDH